VRIDIDLPESSNSKRTISDSELLANPCFPRYSPRERERIGKLGRDAAIVSLLELIQMLCWRDLEWEIQGHRIVIREKEGVRRRDELQTLYRELIDYVVPPRGTARGDVEKVFGVAEQRVVVKEPADHFYSICVSNETTAMNTLCIQYDDRDEVIQAYMARNAFGNNPGRLTVQEEIVRLQRGVEIMEKVKSLLRDALSESSWNR